MHPAPSASPGTGGDIMLHLRENTRDLHDAIEADVAALGALHDEAGHRHYLARLHGFHAPLEPALEAALADGETVPDLAERRKTPLLAADLAGLGLSPAEIGRLPRCAELPAVAGRSRALGCLYVTEGATLGGAILLRQLGERSPSLAARAGRYLGAYGAERGRRWRAFGEAARAHAARTGPGAAAAALAGARDTFDALRRWLGAPGRAP